MRSFFLFLILCSAFAKAQELNNFKYVLVNNQYDFQSSANQYNLNDLIIFELKKYGLEGIKNGSVNPIDFNQGNCNALVLDIEKSGLLGTKMEFIFSDCSEHEVLRLEGKSKKKEFKRAYYEAVREGLAGLKALNYKYEPKADESVSIQEAVPETTEIISDHPRTETITNLDKTATKAKELRTAAFTSRDGKYELFTTALGFELKQNNQKIAELRRGQSGCYLVKGEQVAGLGNLKDNYLIIEIFTDSGSEIIVLEK